MIGKDIGFPNSIETCIYSLSCNITRDQEGHKLLDTISILLKITSRFLKMINFKSNFTGRCCDLHHPWRSAIVLVGGPRQRAGTLHRLRTIPARYGGGLEERLGKGIKN